MRIWTVQLRLWCLPKPKHVKIAQALRKHYEAGERPNELERLFGCKIKSIAYVCYRSSFLQHLRKSLHHFNMTEQSISFWRFRLSSDDLLESVDYYTPPAYVTGFPRQPPKFRVLSGFCSPRWLLIGKSLSQCLIGAQLLFQSKTLLSSCATFFKSLQRMAARSLIRALQRLVFWVRSIWDLLPTSVTWSERKRWGAPFWRRYQENSRVRNQTIWKWKRVRWQQKPISICCHLA